MSATLSIHPAFGFESVERHNVAVAQYDASHEGEKAFHRNWAKEIMYINNISKGLAYIPSLHVIIGLSRMILAYYQRNQDAEFNSILEKQFLRGVAEVLVGFLLIIPDLIQTFREQEIVKQQNAAN